MFFVQILVQMKDYLSMIKFSHTIFALPFAMVGFFLGVNRPGGSFSWQELGLVLLCMVFARSAAMAFNRWLDRDIDAANPRTIQREIPAGVISPRAALWFVIINCLLFVACTYFLNPLVLALSPIALLVILGYSYTKRFTALCHLVLGLGLALAPIGAYLATGGSFDLIPILYSVAVLTWVSGFDIIYALQDREFDESQHLHSIPVALGRVRAMRLSEGLHVVSGLSILAAGYFLAAEYPEVLWLHWAGALIFIGLLIYQHLIVSPTDLRRVNLAFFTTNGVASVVFGCLVILDFFI